MKAINRIVRVMLLGMFCAVIYGEGRARAQHAGDLDPSFGNGGKVRTGFGGGYANCAATVGQADGKLILAGSGSDIALGTNGVFLLARFDTNGVLDPSFGYGGKIMTGVSFGTPLADACINSVKQQSDGKLIAGGFAYRGQAYPSFTLARYNPDGSLDTGFGTNGIVSTDFGQDAQMTAMGIQTDNKIVAVGFLVDSEEVAVARYNTNGTLDTTFGVLGKTVVGDSSYRTIGRAMLIQGNGAIVVVGSADSNADPDHREVELGVLRFTTNGVLDTTFGGTGLVATMVPSAAFSRLTTANAVAIQSGTTPELPVKLVVAGTYDHLTNGFDQELILLARYNLDGSLDTSFGNGGIVTNGFTPNVFAGDGDQGFGLAIQGTLLQPRKMVVAVWSSSYGMCLTRYNSSGSVDTTFGSDGTGTVKFGFGGSQLRSCRLTSQNGELVLAGTYYGSGSFESQMIAARTTAAGAEDLNFGNGTGFIFDELSDLPCRANAVIAQPDGKVIAAGYTQFGLVNLSPFSFSKQNAFAMARYNLDGTLDTSFGLDGLVYPNVVYSLYNLEDAQANALALEPDGGIVAAGSISNSFGVVRFLKNGSIDKSFGNGGIGTLVGGTNSEAKAVQIQPDGKIIAAGDAPDPISTSSKDFVLARFNTNGSLDTTFGNGGTVMTSFVAQNVSIANSLRIQADGKYTVGGYTAATNGSSVSEDFALARYNTNGSLDFSFGTLGRAVTSVAAGTLDLSEGMALQPDGKIVAVGSAVLGLNSYVALARFNTNGFLDGTFGSGGTVITQVGATSDAASSVAVQSDGKIVVAGQSLQQLYRYFVQRYNPDGSLDTSFGAGGTTLMDFDSGTNEFNTAMTIDTAGRAILAGDGGEVFGIARLEGTALPSLSISSTATNSLLISWPGIFTGWNLQQEADVRASNWTVARRLISNDGTNNFVIINPLADTMFYRLVSP